MHLVAQVEEELVQFFLVFGIQASRRFVCKDDGRVVDKGAGNGYALFLSPRQFVRFVRHPVGQIHEVEDLLRSLLRRSRFFTGDQCGDHHVLQSCELRKKLMELENETDVPVAECCQFLFRKADGFGPVYI